MIRLLAVAAVALSALSTAHAETKVGFRQLTIVEPVAVQRGTEADVTLRSNFTLDGTHTVFFDRPGIEMNFAETEPKEAARRGRGSDGTPFAFKVRVPEDQMPGVYEIRVATDQAVSSVSQLLVTDLPVVREDESVENGTLDTATEIELPAAVCGRVEKFEDVDMYRFAGQAGQTLTFNLFAQRVTDKIHGMVVRGPKIYLMDGLLVLYGPNRQVIAQNDNTYGGDSFLAVTLPSDGEYMLEVRDARYAGSGRYAYCVEISERPHVFATLPMAVQPGRLAPLKLIGPNVGDSPIVEFTTPDSATSGWHQPTLATPAGATNPVHLLVSEHPQAVASGDNVSRETAQPIEVPSGISGQLAEPDQAHWYSFAATRGDRFRFETHAHRVGLPTDTLIEVYDESGKRLAEADDADKTKDSVLYWTAPAEGTFTLAVRDLHARGGERFVYHLSAEPSGPDFELSGEYYYAQIAPGTNMLWFAKISRLNGLDAAVEIVVDGLPEGVTQEPVSIPKGMNHCAILLKCAEDAPIGASLVSISGRAEIDDGEGGVREIVRSGRIVCEQQSSGGGQAKWPINTSIVGVTKPLDLTSVTAEPTEITLEPGGTAEIDVTIARSEGFTDPVTLAMSFDYFTNKLGEQLPPGVTVGKASSLRLAGGNLKGKVVLEASNSAVPVEKLPISVLARVSITFSITTNYGSNPIYLTLPAKTETVQK
jgi:hypothetical protein